MHLELYTFVFFLFEKRKKRQVFEETQKQHFSSIFVFFFSNFKHIN